MSKNEINETLDQRGESYGSYNDQSKITQTLKDVMRDTPNWNDLPHYMKESLEMTAMKIARILNGDPKHEDSWHDIVGYISLVELELKGEGK